MLKGYCRIKEKKRKKNYLVKRALQHFYVLIINEVKNILTVSLNPCNVEIELTLLCSISPVLPKYMILFKNQW